MSAAGVSIGRMLDMLHDLDPRDRRNALWVVSPDVYEALSREYHSTIWPESELVEVGKTPPTPGPAKLFGVEVWVRYDLPVGTTTLDVDDPVTRAVKRARERDPGQRHVTVNLLQPERIEFAIPAPAPEVTLRALARKWWKRVKP